ncbi:amidohydrolase [Kitasatospora cinereorecta]|uniref:M20 family metallopeptidase n=1 Tax=Kitasatospora cinereorecta TaxID=285560 RepID=A0ABW0V8K9_9ACTN
MNRPNTPAFSRRALLGATAAAGVGAVVPSPAEAEAAHHRPLDQHTIDAAVRPLSDELVALRRALHEHPETSGQEQWTSATVAERLRAAGLKVTTGVGGTGVVGVLTGARPGRTVAYRADMDAVPPDGIVTGGTVPAHVCGHDLHTTIGVGVAQVLARLRHRLSGTVVFLFQPGEEALAGARAMIGAGVLDGTWASAEPPAEIHALHCGPFPVGRFAVTPGVGLPGQDQAQITLTGPDAADQAKRLVADVSALSTVAFPQTPADLEKMVADVQTPDGPLARFTVTRARAKDADAEGRVAVQVSFRCWPEERYTEVREQIRRLAQPYPGAQTVFPGEPFPALVCPAEDADALARHLRRVIDPAAATVLHAAFPFNGEDFALFLDRLPGTYTFLGVRSPGAGITSAYPHFGDFHPDERAIGLGVRAMAGWLSARTAA